jgi:aryl-alcohol dehydrogenase-like predicted oxidoreductase
MLGECRRQDGRPIIIATKWGPLPTRSSPEHMLKALDGSLQRLGVECIDLYQIHFPTAPQNVDALMDTMAEAVRAGKIRAVGVSNFNASLMRRAHARLARHRIALASNQVHYSLLYRHAERNGVLDACRELDVALIAYSPMEQGILSGKYRGGTGSTPFFLRLVEPLTRLDMFGETRGSMPALQRLLSGPRTLPRDQWEALFVVMEEIARAHEKSIAQVALNWLLCTDPHIIPIPGAKNARQASANAGALGWRLTEAEYARISQTATT